MQRIRFRINYEVKQKRKFEEFIDGYQKKIGLELKGLKIERYWKLEGQFQANFFVEIDCKEKAKRVYDVLILANQLWSSRNSNWAINGPYEG